MSFRTDILRAQNRVIRCRADYQTASNTLAFARKHDFNIAREEYHVCKALDVWGRAIDILSLIERGNP